MRWWDLINRIIELVRAKYNLTERDIWICDTAPIVCISAECIFRVFGFTNRVEEDIDRERIEE